MEWNLVTTYFESASKIVIWFSFFSEDSIVFFVKNTFNNTDTGEKQIIHFMGLPVVYFYGKPMYSFFCNFRKKVLDQYWYKHVSDKS